jgi:pimeloyl-ACP methyl ester carboxylesterase
VTLEVKAKDGYLLSVDSLGGPDGLPVFLLHGTPGSRNGPRPRGIVLHRLGIRLITYDRPGYPGSDRRPGRRVVDAAKDVETIADALRLKQFSVVGRSGGAPHALACTAELGDRVLSAAALGSLAPYRAEGLDWPLGMTESNVRAYQNAENDLAALINMLNEQAVLARGNSEGLLPVLWPDLAGYDKEVIGDIALRRIIAEVHADALSKNIDGWVDDVVALSQPWGFDLSQIAAPVKLWAGHDDVFSPASHTRWLGKRIPYSDVEIAPKAAHFGAVSNLPRILSWVAAKANALDIARERAGALR